MIKGKIISATEAQRGQGKFGEWRRYDVVISTEQNFNGEVISCFNDKVLEMIGQQGTWEVQEKQVEKNGKIYNNRALLIPKEDKFGQILEAMARLEDKLDEIIGNQPPQMISDSLPPHVKANSQIPF